MTRPAEPRLHRFTLAERAVHWLTGILVVICIVTAAILYNGSLAVLIGNRRTVELVHVYCGFALPVPMIVGLASVAYRADIRRLNRFGRADWKWLRSRRHRMGRVGVGKFNVGQKLNAALSAGSILVLFGSGLLMYYPDWTRIAWRTGATFVHDWFALAFGLLVVGHLSYALRDLESMRGMTRGYVSRAWAADEHDQWLEEAGADELGDG